MDHQRYSTENQADAIAAYAARRNREIARTYNLAPPPSLTIINGGRKRGKCKYS
jgi:hypothetical protein